MQVHEIPLVSPRGTRIVGYLTKSGTTCPVTCRFGRAEGDAHFLLEIPAGMTEELLVRNGQHVYVDADGAQWLESDVMWFSVPDRP